MRTISLVLISIFIFGCSSTDYDKSYSSITNCDGAFQANNKSQLSKDKKFQFNIGGKGTNCLSGIGGKQFYQFIKLPKGTELLTVWSHPNLGMNKSSFYLPQLLIQTEEGFKELPYSYEVKGSAFPTESYYVYHFDLREVEVENAVITTASENFDKLFQYEHLNSYDYSSITKSQMPFSRGGIVDVVAYSKYNLKW